MSVDVAAELAVERTARVLADARVVALEAEVARLRGALSDVVARFTVEVDPDGPVTR